MRYDGYDSYYSELTLQEIDTLEVDAYNSDDMWMIWEELSYLTFTPIELTDF